MNAEGAPDYFTLASLLVRHHCSSVDEADGGGVVNIDTLADDMASRLEAMAQALRAILATIALPDDLLEKAVAAIVAAEKAP